MSFGKRLRTLRKNMGLTQQNLADRIDVSRIYIQALESNRRMPSMKLLHRMTEALQVTISDLVEDLSARTARVHLEEILLSGEIDVWFHKRKLSAIELKRAERVIAAVLDDQPPEELEAEAQEKTAPEKKRRARGSAKNEKIALP
jgi:transcriptional regulator with XRE-family HTH domain